MFLCRVTQYKRNEYIYLSNSPEAIFLGEKQVGDCSIASFYKKETDLIVGDDSRKRKNGPMESAAKVLERSMACNQSDCKLSANEIASF